MSWSPFSSSSPAIPSLVSDDPHLEVVVTPSASAFYAGETFSARIVFRNTRTPSLVRPSSSVPRLSGDVGIPISHPRQFPPPGLGDEKPRALPRRTGNIGAGIPVRGTRELQEEEGNAQAGPSRQGRNPLAVNTGRIEGGDEGYRVPHSSSPTRSKFTNVRSPEAYQDRYAGLGKGQPGAGRRTKSLAMGEKGMSPQEMVWALGAGGGGSHTPSPPPLPTRRTPSGKIPSHHPHSRKDSIASTAVVTSPPSSDTSLPPDLPPIPESSIPPPTSRSSSGLSTSSYGSSNVIDLNDDDGASLSAHAARERPSRSRRSSGLSSGSRAPSYSNAYGAAYLSPASPSPPLAPPPSHPYSRGMASSNPPGTTTILWAYTRLVSHFHPSNTYIPPDPLLPLRSMLLHQPVGSGSLAGGDAAAAQASRGGGGWQMSFGTGTVGNSSTPSFTGSLFGLAKDLVYGGTGGSLEEERKRVWNMKDLPVFETARSLLGVDLRLKEGESKEFIYTLQLPSHLPPAHRGKAFRFSYDLVVSLSVSLPGVGKRQKSKDIEIPIRVWANISLVNPLKSYDILKPVIHTKDEAVVTEPDTASAPRKAVAADKMATNAESSVEEYAKHLLSTTRSPTPVENGDAPSGPVTPVKSTGPPPPRRGSPTPSSPRPFGLGSPIRGPLGLVNGNSPSISPSKSPFRLRKGSFVKGDDELLDEAQEDGGCGEAVEVLSRHSAKASYDIAKDGDVVAVLTLIKTTFRLGETVLGVVTFNHPESDRRVLKLTACLESHELIPENLLPLSASSAGRSRQPALTRVYAEDRAAYVQHLTSMPFSLDIPSDATPAFGLLAGGDGEPGGLEWRVKISFLVSVPPRKQHRRMLSSTSATAGHGEGGGTYLTPVREAGGRDADNKVWSATAGIAPLSLAAAVGAAAAPAAEGGLRAGGQGRWEEARTEMMECEVPIRVLAGNTAFVVRSSTFVV